jgi:ABC-2 type transport system permease protein
MTAQLRSELLKVRTTRTVPMLLLGAAALTLFAVFVEGLSPSAAKLATERTQRELLTAVTSAVLLATVAGIVIVTAEHRYGTIRPTLLVQPRRRVVLGAKLVTAALTGLAFAAVCVALAFGAGLALLAVRGADVALTTPHTLELVFGTAGASALSAMLGVAVGTLVRSQSGAIVALLAYAFVADAILFAAVPSVGRFLPGKAGDALLGRPVDDLLGVGTGGAVLVLWTLALAAAAAVRSARGDV